MENESGPVLGVTLYSFTNSWLLRLYDLDGLVAQVAELGLGPTVEVVGFQSFRSYPDVTPEFASYFRNLLDQYALVPNCLGANVDIGIRKDRMMTTDETVDYIRRQIVTAQALGFPILRGPTYPNLEVLEQIVPIAEKAGVHVAVEIHSPINLSNPMLIELLEYYQKIQSPVLGLIPDFSASMTAPPEVYWESLRDDGAEEDLIDTVKTIWETDSPMYEKFAAVGEAAQKFHATPVVASRMNNATSMFGHMPVEDWRELLPYVRHIHGKFYGVNDDGVEPSVPYHQLMPLLRDLSYAGTISAEWEGHAFTGETIGFDQVKAWRSMCTRLLAE
jgi:hypothetical protein